ncbi:uncharacterized protein LOC144612792 isoform X2 [Panthera onca]
MRDRHHSSLRNSWKQAVEGTHMRSGYLVVYIEAAPCRLHSSHGSTPEAMSQQPVQSEESSRAEEHKTQVEVPRSHECHQWQEEDRKRNWKALEKRQALNKGAFIFN